MKFEPDTEMDRLLRRQARRQAAAASSSSEAARETIDESVAETRRTSGTHLDADEMNAYAEGALPDATRSRYFSHLADCGECRHLVTKLTLAANVPTVSSTRQTTAAVSPSRSWREWLAALFSPPVLRYGVPALALLAVMIVAFVATREQRQANLVAQNEQSREASSATAPVSQEEQAAQTTTGTTAATDEKGTVNANANATANSPRQADATTEAAEFAQEKQAGKKEGEAVATLPAQPNEPKPVEQQPASGGIIGRQTSDRDEGATIAKAQPPPIVVTPAAKAPVDDGRGSDEEDVTKTDRVSDKNKVAKPAPSTGASRVYREDGTGTNQNEPRRAQKSGTRERAARSERSANTQLSSEAAGPEAKDNRAGETKSVGGREFRRQGGAWVDTAYNSGRSTINVARGSEQYRALVADEPGIRAIVEKLGGTVIVVWKRQAYRIY